MANSHSYVKKNGWMYLSVGLMAILALGFSFPQAYAHVTSDMKHGVEHVIALLTDIQTKVTGIKSTVDTNLDAKVSSRATQTSVDGINTKVTNIETIVGGLGSGDAALLESIKCNSAIRSKVDLSGCDLSLATLNSAMLNKANLSGADLHSINLISASLVSGNLSNANLSSATLIDATLPFSNLSSANLSSANLKDADLTFANLSSANLSNANFDGALLGSADFAGCIGDPIGTPSTGTLPDCA